MKTTDGPPKPVARHPLLENVSPALHDWQQWLMRWETDGITLSERRGLVEDGFNVRFVSFRPDGLSFSNEDRILFYLRIAEGWARPGFFESPLDPTRRDYLLGIRKDGSYDYGYVADVRQRIAVRAFELLWERSFSIHCQSTLFEIDRRVRERFEYRYRIATLLPGLMAFFREENRLSNHFEIANLTECTDQSETKHQAVKFVVRLSRFMWKVLEQNINESDPETFRNDETTPEGRTWSIRVLAKLNKLHVIREFAPYFGKGDVEVLREISMRNRIRPEHGVSKTRQVRTIEEARITGCPAADLFAYHQFLTRHKRRTRCKP